MIVYSITTKELTAEGWRGRPVNRNCSNVSIPRIHFHQEFCVWDLKTYWIVIFSTAVVYDNPEGVMTVPSSMIYLQVDPGMEGFNRAKRDKVGIMFLRKQRESVLRISSKSLEDGRKNKISEWTENGWSVIWNISISDTVRTSNIGIVGTFTDCVLSTIHFFSYLSYLLVHLLQSFWVSFPDLSPEGHYVIKLVWYSICPNTPNRILGLVKNFLIVTKKPF